MEKNLIIYILILILLKNINTRSINYEETNGEKNENGLFNSSILPIICIGGVILIVVSGGFCLFSRKPNMRNNSSSTRLNPSQDESNNNQNSNSTSTTTNSGNSGKRLYNENEDKNLSENKIDITETKIKDSTTTNNEIKEIKNNNNEGSDSKETKHNGKNDESGSKRKSFLGIPLPSKNSFNSKRNSFNSKRNSYQIQIMDDRSENSISTNEDWINEQKYQAHIKAVERGEMEDDDENNQYNDEMDCYDNESNDISNDGFWPSELEPIQSSSSKKEESYAVPSLGRRSTMIIMAGGEQNMSNKRQSVIIMEEENINNFINNDNNNDNNINEYKSESDRLEEEFNKERMLKPTRVTSWKDKDLNKEVLEILKGLDEEYEKKEKENEEITKEI